MKIVVKTAIIFLSLISCSSKKFDSPKELLEFVSQPTNGYLFKKEINNVNISLLLKPTDLLVKQHISNEIYNNSIIDSLRKKYEKYIYFNISISSGGKELLSSINNREKFGALVNQLAFGMDKKVHLFTPQKDTIAIADYIYPRLYGMSDETTMLFVYPKEKKVLDEEYVNISIEDFGFQTGEVRFKVPTKIIREELKLNFKEFFSSEKYSKSINIEINSNNKTSKNKYDGKL